MAYFMVAVIVDNKSNIVGYRLTDTNNPAFKSHKPCFADVKAPILANMLSNGHKVENLKLEGNRIISSGSIERYPKISLSGNQLISKPSYTVILVSDTDVYLCDAFGNLLVRNLDVLYTENLYYNNYRLSNAKMVVRNGKLSLYSLSNGSLRRVDKSNKTTISADNRKYKLPNYKKEQVEEWEFITPNNNSLIIKSELSNGTDLLDRIQGIVRAPLHGILTGNTYGNKVILKEKLFNHVPDNRSEFFFMGHHVGHTAYFCGWLFDTVVIPGIGDVCGICVTELTYTDNNKYLLLYSLDFGHWNTYTLLKDIIHIGKGYVQLGICNQQIKEDKTIIGLGLSGLILIEKIGLRDAMDSFRLEDRCNRIWSDFSFHCVPYSKLKSKEQIIKALSTLNTLDRNEISEDDISLILKASMNCKYEVVVTDSLCGTAFERIFEDGCYSKYKTDNAVNSIWVSKSALQTSGKASSELAQKRGIIYSSLLIEMEAYLGDSFGYIKGQEDNVYLVGDDFGNIVDDREQAGRIRLYSYIELRHLGYVALHKAGRVQEIGVGWIRQEQLDIIKRKVWGIKISDNTLEFGYLNFKIVFDYSKLMGLYRAEYEKTLSSFNLKHSVLNSGLRIDGDGILIEYNKNSFIKQNRHIKGIDVGYYDDPMNASITVGVTGEFRIVKRNIVPSSGDQCALHLLFNKDTLHCMDMVSLGSRCTVIDSVIFDLDGVSNTDELDRMLRVYLYYSWMSENKDKLEKEKICGHPLKWFIQNAGDVFNHGKGVFVNYVGCSLDFEVRHALGVDKNIRIGLLKSLIPHVVKYESMNKDGYAERLFEIIMQLILEEKYIPKIMDILHKYMAGTGSNS